MENENVLAVANSANSEKPHIQPVYYRRNGLRFIECWLDHMASPWPRADVASLIQFSTAPPEAWVRPFDTLTINLTDSEVDLRSRLNRDTRYKINRDIDRDGITFHHYRASLACIDSFANFYNEFSTSKGLPSLDRRILNARANANLLQLSCARSADRALVWHAYLHTGEAATLVHSASHFRQSDDKEYQSLVGRANRALHWIDFLHFKKAGCLRYDFGGWYAGESDESLLQINRFKEGFGGVHVKQVRAIIGLTKIGKLAVALRKTLTDR